MRAPGTNRLLTALPRGDRQHFLAGCERVELVHSDILYEPGTLIRHVYLPTDSYISLISPIDNHTGLEIALVGNEGMHGIALALGIDNSPFHVLVQGGGPALRMNAAIFRRELQFSPALHQSLNRYIYTRMNQIARTVACTRFHVVEERLARRLLMAKDRTYSDEMHITHEILANMLGVRRVGITKAACSLQRRELIRYSRGTITVLDRLGLEAASCPCYHTDKKIYGP